MLYCLHTFHFGAGPWRFRISEREEVSPNRNGAAYTGLKFLFTDKQFLRTIRNTIAMSVINTSLGFIVPAVTEVFLRPMKAAHR